MNERSLQDRYRCTKRDARWALSLSRLAMLGFPGTAGRNEFRVQAANFASGEVSRKQ
jgi:hypothetical protein